MLWIGEFNVYSFSILYLFHNVFRLLFTFGFEPKYLDTAKQKDRTVFTSELFQNYTLELVNRSGILIDRSVVGFIMPTSLFAVYNRSLDLVKIPVNLYNIAFGKTYLGEFKTDINFQALKSINNYACEVSILIVFASIVPLEIVIPLLLGEQFEEYTHAFQFALILIPLRVLRKNFGLYMRAKGKVRLAFNVEIGYLLSTLLVMCGISIIAPSLEYFLGSVIVINLMILTYMLYALNLNVYFVFPRYVILYALVGLLMATSSNEVVMYILTLFVSLILVKRIISPP